MFKLKQLLDLNQENPVGHRVSLLPRVELFWPDPKHVSDLCIFNFFTPNMGFELILGRNLIAFGQTTSVQITHIMLSQFLCMHNLGYAEQKLFVIIYS